MVERPNLHTSGDGTAQLQAADAYIWRKVGDS